MKIRLVTYTFLYFFGFFFYLCNSLYGQADKVYTLTPDIDIQNLGDRVDAACSDDKDFCEINLSFYSEFTDSAKFVLLPGNWDKIIATIIPENGRSYQVKSGHFVPKKDKTHSSWIFYEPCMLQRMGLQNQIEFTIAPKEKIKMSILAEQTTDLILFKKLELRNTNLEIESKGLFRYIFQFLFLGVIMILFVYHFTIFLGYREPLYLYYALYMGFMILHTVDYNGLNSEVFFANHLSLRPFLKIFADNGIVIFYLLLLRRIIRPVQYGKSYDKWTKGLIIFQILNFCVSLGILIFTDNVMIAMVMGLLFSIPAMILVIFIAFPVYNSRDKAGKFFITGSIFLLLGNLINGAMYAAGIEGPAIWGYFDRIQVFQFSSLIELLWFSFAIAQRIRRIDIEQERIKTVDRIKSKLFTYVFEQSRNPLTMILGPTRSMLEKLRKSSKLESDNLQFYLESIDRNAIRLLEGTDQLLDLAKVDEGKMKVYAREHKLGELLSALIASSQKMAGFKQITLEVENPYTDLSIYTDEEKMRQIIDSALKRAFLQVKENGKVKLSVEKQEESVYIHIWSSDEGIAPGNLARIFERFYNFDPEKPEFRNVFGIRMALAWELAKILKGSLKVESEQGSYTEFILELPLGSAHLNEYELLEEAEDTRETIHIIWEQPVVDIPTPSHTSNGERPQILVIEEDAEIRKFIAFIHQNEFSILEAENGKEGLRLAKEYLPDLIISEVQVPILNGIDLARKLKLEEDTQHIPIVLLSTQVDDKFQLDGYKLGIEAFLLKPFDSTLLKERVKNIINQRILLRKKYLQEFLAGSQQVIAENGEGHIPLPDLPQSDLEFIQKVKQSLTDNLHEESYSVERLAEDSHYQRRQLNRKVKDLFGTTPAFLIREHRMNKACDLLAETTMKLATIAEAVGYKNATSLSKAFKEHVGESPAAYRKRFQHRKP